MKVSTIALSEVRSVTEFQRNIRQCVGHLNDKELPIVLTVNGRSEIVVKDEASYQEVLDRSATKGTLAAIRRSKRDADEGRVTTFR